MLRRMREPCYDGGYAHKFREKGRIVRLENSVYLFCIRFSKFGAENVRKEILSGSDGRRRDNLHDNAQNV